ncbi:MAG: hypothetical protein IPM69_12685 [Ignavibacteria bacterium]|nr:hypothetical protein [Ignavibacteria bacterium]
MKNYKTLNYILLFGLAAFITLIGCKDFVQNIEPPNDSTEDINLNSEQEIDFLMNGVKAKFATTYSELTCLAGGLSDELVYDPNFPGATYPQYFEVEVGIIKLNNTSIENAITNLGSLRMHADTLIGRASVITFKDDNLRNQALATGYIYGALARYLWASYFGLNENNGGGVINSGPFIPASAMYDLALKYIDSAARYSQGDLNPVAYSLKAKIHLIEGRLNDADTAAQNGMSEIDKPFEAKFSKESVNFWYNNAGKGRTQFLLSRRYLDYTSQDSREIRRVSFANTQGIGNYIYQSKYFEDKTPIIVMSWQENSLMRAELSWREYMKSRMESDSTSAMTYIDAVRASHGLDPLAVPLTLDEIFNERDKELFCTGARLIDQRRSGKWHLSNSAWRYLPITEAERTRNPNLLK